MSSPQEFTTLLTRIGEGDRDAYDHLLPLVYGELHTLAEHAMAGERPDHTLGATSLVHEAYLRLVGQTPLSWQNRAHFLGVAARAMRQILIEHARRRRSKKRGGGAQRVTLSPIASPSEVPLIDLVALDEALTALAEQDPRKAQVVELRFFGGLNRHEAAEVLGITLRTVDRDWNYAQAWLQRELAGREEERRAGGDDVR